jgi:hypothetical protein
MNRRDALLRVATMVGATMTLPGMGSSALADTLEASATQRLVTGKPVLFTADQDALVAELADVIIPTTNTPGAKAAKVNEIIDVVLKDCYKKPDQQAFIDGLAQTQKMSQDAYGKAYTQLDNAQKIDIMKKLEAEAKLIRKVQQDTTGGGQQDVQIPKEKLRQTPFFYMLKDLTLMGYFTSEIGATQALEYVAIPGKFEGCVPLKPGQKAWAI